LERCQALEPEEIVTYWDLAICCQRVGDQDRRRRWSKEGLPRYEKHLRLNPDDEIIIGIYANLLYGAGEVDRAREYLKSLKNVREGLSLFNLACLAVQLSDIPLALRLLAQAVEAGYANRNALENDPDIAPLRVTPEFADIVAKLH
jgi:tetratricopeptide (TPR) repeat protein